MLYRSAPGPTLARVRRPTAARPTRLAVVADPHVTPWATGTWTVLHRAEERLATAIADIDRANVDAVVLLGDLTRDGRRVAFDRIDELLAELDVPVLAVPGERDVPKAAEGHRTPPVEAFAERYGDGGFPFVKRVGGVDLVGIDTATMPDGSLADAHGGAVSAGQLDWLESILPGLTNPVVVCHHNVSHAATRTVGLPASQAYRLANADELVRVCSAGGVDLVLSGHAHWPATATIGGLREVIAPATCSLPQAYLEVEIGPAGTTVDLCPLADRAGFEEAYAYARNGDARGQRLADCADSGYLSRLPLVDELPSARQRHGDLAHSEQ